MRKFTANDIALWFLAKTYSKINENIVETDEFEVYEGITHLKLQKLLYYAQGVFSAFNNGSPLFKQKILAWPHGPVVKEVYDEYKEFKRNEINKKLTDEDFSKIAEMERDPDIHATLEVVYDNFAGYTAWQLRNKTHEIGSPWDVTINTKGEGKEINLSLIKEYFFNNVIEK